MTIEKIEDGVVVSLAYTLTVDGEVVDRADTGEPLEYLHGAENIVPGLETALTGKKVGDKVNVTLTPDQAYGDYDEDEVEEVDKADIDQADQLQTGMLIEAEDDEGYVTFGLVKEITPDTIVLDFNPPLAGKTLTYDVQVIGLREAQQDELMHGHPHSLHSHYQHSDDGFVDDDDDFYDDDDYDSEDNGYYDNEDDEA